MSGSNVGNPASRWGIILLWWHSWIGRFSIHLPLLLCAFAYYKIEDTAQGQSALEFPVERPLAAVFVVGLLVGACAFVARQLAVGYRLAGVTAPVLTLGNALRAWRSWKLNGGAAPWPCGYAPPAGYNARLVLFACFVLFGPFLVSGVLTVASASDVTPEGGLGMFAFGNVCGFVAVPLFGLLLWGLRRLAGILVRRPPASGFIVAASPVIFAIILYCGGIYLVTNDLGALAALGPYGVIVSGLLVMTLFFQGAAFLLVTHATFRWIWVLIVAGIIISVTEAPLSERANPYLVTTPSVERASSVCSRLAPVANAPDASSAKPASQPTGPSILVSAEGGGIRAAYWTAVSLEELAEARGGTLTGVDVLSGVSGGSLGVATFLAAQDLPLEARLSCIREFLSGDFLSPLAAGLLFLDVPRLFISSWFLDTHRGDYFEEYIARRWLMIAGTDYFYRPLKQAAKKAGARVPSVYFNSTDAFSGQYIALTARQADAAGAGDQFVLTATNKAVLGQLADLRIAQAVHMSARFPYLSPTPDLRVPADKASQVLFGQTKSAEKLKKDVSLVSLVDGGYFDNSGLWPALRLLEHDQGSNPRPERFVLHIINDQVRSCEEGSSNDGCVNAEAVLLEKRASDRGGWLLRPMDAIQDVQSQHSLQSITALQLTQSQLKGKVLIWPVPMPALPAVPGFWGGFLDYALTWLPVHGRDLRRGVVSLGWTLAPLEAEFLCVEAARIRTENVPGVGDRKPIDRTKECSLK